MSAPAAKVLVLGTGTSHGVPMIGCECGTCRSTDPRDRRSRASIYIQIEGGASVLVDTTPDLRMQALTHGLKRVDAIFPLARPLQEISIVELPRPNKGRDATPSPADLDPLLAPARAGRDLGLLSEAGLPAVADPGAALVAAAHGAGIAVVAHPGANSIVLAIAASGMNGQSFAFVGYIPVPAEERAARIRGLEATSRRDAQTQVLIETPYRNGVLLEALLAHLQPTTRLSVSVGLTLPGGFSRSDSVAGWRQRPTRLPADVPAVFALLAGR